MFLFYSFLLTTIIINPIFTLSTTSTKNKIEKENVTLNTNHTSVNITQQQVLNNETISLNTTTKVNLNNTVGINTNNLEETVVKSPIENVHRGRENVTDNTTKKTTSSERPLQLNTLYVGSEKNDNKSSKARKGATFPTSKLIMTTTTTTIKPKPKKPTVTIDDSNTNIESSKEKANNMSSLYIVPHKSSTNFIVPIVAVILSVPLVAIIISVLYKRGSEWWLHRHYSRMDFLIDGMYNN